MSIAELPYYLAFSLYSVSKLEVPWFDSLLLMAMLVIASFSLPSPSRSSSSLSGLNSSLSKVASSLLA